MTGLLTILTLPVLALVLVVTLDVGALRVVAARARSAADLAVLVAVNDQDDAELARSGALRPSTDAATTARSTFRDNLAPIAGALAGAPDAIAAAATVGVETSPSTIRLTAVVPVSTPAFAALLARPTVDVAVAAAASAR